MQNVTINKLRAAGITCDMVSKKRNGNYILRKGFFYTSGMTAEKIAEKLKEKFPTIVIINTYEQWKPFKGGQTVAHGSHWGVEFKFQ